MFKKVTPVNNRIVTNMKAQFRYLYGLCEALLITGCHVEENAK